MSQAGLIDIEASHPQIATSFLTDAGTAIPIANVLEILGGSGIETSGAGNIVTVAGIDATAGATALLATKGVSSFDSAYFTIAGGYVTLAGGIGIETFLTDDGVPVVEPNPLGVVEIVGGIGITSRGEGPGNVITLDGEDSTTANNAMVYLATDAQSISGGSTANYAINPSSLKAKLGVQTDHGLLVGSGQTAAITALAVGVKGELVTGNTGADPGWATVSYGDFSFSNITDVATPRMLSVVNTDVNAASHADLRLSTPPLGGDSLISWEVQGSHFFAAGVDNQVAGDPWKLSNSSHPSAGTAAITVDATTAAVTFASAYEFPVADGNASEVLVTDGAGNLDFAASGSLLTDLDNTLFVGKHGNDANNGKTSNNAKLTIQAAVTAAAAGDTIIVYPGPYTETVTHAANNVTLRAQGKPGTCVIAQADANVVDVNTQTGIFYDGFRIVCTAATTAINTVQLSTGSATFRFCRLEMYCAAAIAAVAQPAIGAVTGAGMLIVAFGRHKFEHTGNGGATAQKGAFRVGTGGEVDLTRIEEFDIVNSGTALASTVGIDTSSTGFFKMNGCNIEITDPNATVVAGLAYLGGTGTENEFRRNTIHINVTNNIGYGFFASDTASTSRFFYNHMHVTDVAGTSFSYHIGNTATVISQFDDIVAADGIQLVAGGTFTCTSSLADGELTCRGREAGGIVQASVMNMDNTATAGNAALNLSVGGTTSTGDPYVHYLVTGSTEYSLGIDNSSAGDMFKLTNGATPSAGTTYALLDIPASRWEFPINITLQEISNDGGGVQNNVSNTSDTADSAAFYKAQVGGTSGGDPYINFDVPSGSEFSVGIDNSDADAFKIGPNASPSAGNSDFEIAAATGAITFSEAYTFPVADGNASDVLTTDGSGAVTWEANSSLSYLTYAEETGAAKTIVINYEYGAKLAGGVSFTLPSTAAVGTRFAITGILGLWDIIQGANQYICMGDTISTVGAGGSLTATNLGDCITATCIEEDLGWRLTSMMGNITIV